LEYGEIGIKAEGLREITGLRTHVARGVAKDLHAAGRRLHDSGDYLEGRSLAGPVRADQAENLRLPNGKVEPPDRLYRAIVLLEITDLNGSGCGPIIRRRRQVGLALASDCGYLFHLCGGHVVP